MQEAAIELRDIRKNYGRHTALSDVSFSIPQGEIFALLVEMGLEDRRKALVMTLSMGMRRRLEIARTLLHQARILILDEPTVGLDTASRAGVWRYIDSLRRTRGLTVVVSTHYIEDVEQADRVCIIDAGRVIALDTPESLKARHGAAMLRVVAQNPQTQARILARYGDIALLDKGEIRLSLPDADFQRRFLTEFGSDLAFMSLERDRLEAIFLSLTGRPFDPAKAPEPSAKALP